MSTYLELCNDVKRECGLLGTEISSVVSQTGVNRRIVHWVAQEWERLQRRANWRWMRRTATVNTVADDDTYAPADWTDITDSAAISRFGHWWISDLEDPPKAYLQSTGVGGQYWLTYAPWEWWKSIYRIGSQTSTNPAHISVDHNNNVCVGPAPSAVYVLTCDYQMSAQALNANDDTPDMPADFHDLLVWRAVENYGWDEENKAHISKGKIRGNRVLRQLEADQLPRFRLGAPLA